MELKHMHATGLTHLTLTELHTCQAYFDRLYFAILKMSDYRGHDTIKTWARDFVRQMKRHLSLEWLKNQERESGHFSDELTLKEAQEFTRYFFKTLEGLIALEVVGLNQRANLYTKTLNTLYRCAYQLHHHTNELLGHELDIQNPRVLMMDEIQEAQEPEENQENNQGNVIPLYQVSEKQLRSVDDSSETSIQSLELQRQKRFENLIEQAHELIQRKNFKQAQIVLEKALNYQETAQAYNLLSWCYSLQGEIKTAKSLCMKAIKTDPAHGAAYNDLGSYLLSEGEVKESLKWFELAKNARQYQNREFAFINAGRAYVELREFKKALKEFSLALTLAPENDELHKTVSHLKETLNRSKVKVDHTPPPSLF
jgi:Tfp pilus assembly protein PilF